MHSSGFGNGVFRYRNENILVSSDVLPKDLFVEKLKEFSDFIRKTFAIKLRCICKGNALAPTPFSSQCSSFCCGIKSLLASYEERAFALD